MIDLAVFHAVLDAKRKADGLSWREVASRAGVSASTLSRIQKGHAPDLDGFARLVRWSGASADELIEHEPSGETLPVIVSRHLRTSRELGPKKARALQAIVEAAYYALR